MTHLLILSLPLEGGGIQGEGERFSKEKGLPKEN